MRDHCSARGQIGTVPVRKALAGLARALHSIVVWAVDQVVLLTQNIEHFFKAKKRAGVVFVNLTATYGTVWHRGLSCKLLRLLPDKDMPRMIMKLIRNRSFTLTTGDTKYYRLHCLRNSVLQASVSVPFLLIIYTYDLHSNISRELAYPDELALLHSFENWKNLKGTLI